GYFKGRPIIGSHGSTFHLLQYFNYATDGFDIFYEATPLHVLDAKNYRRIPTVTNAWATDGKAFYWHNQKVPTEDIENFMIFVDTKGETVECFSKDKNWVYNGTSKLNFNRKGEKFIDTIDAATFE